MAVQFLAEPIRIEGPVARQGVECAAPDQRRHADAVMPPARRQTEARQAAQRIGHGDDLVVNPPRERPMA